MNSYYGFIKVDGTKRTTINVDFLPRDVFGDMYIIEAVFETLTPVHIGTGDAKIVDNMPLYLHARDTDGIPIIPGSSMKGAISTIYLALSGKIGDVSELFGATRPRSLISKVFFNDFKATNGFKMVNVPLQRLWRPTRKPEYPAVKYYLDVPYIKPERTEQLIECVDVNAKFRGDIVGYGLRRWEIGGLIMSLGLKIENQRTYIKPLKIGYAKPQGLGKIKLVLENLRIKVCEVDKQSLNLNLKEIRALEDFLTSFLQRYAEANKRYEEVFR